MDEHGGVDPAALRMDDPWGDTAAAGGWLAEGEAVVAEAPDHRAPRPRTPMDGVPARQDPERRTALYLEVQESPAFREVRERYRRFVFPVAAGFVAWYLLYVVAATTAPRLMAHRLTGQLNVAMAAGLAQFATTFLLTWAYARHARLHRDRLALDLRWTLATRTGQERLR